MLQLVCEIFLALVTVFLVYLAFRKIFIGDNIITSVSEEESKDSENKFKSDIDNTDNNVKKSKKL